MDALLYLELQLGGGLAVHVVGRAGERAAPLPAHALHAQLAEAQFNRKYIKSFSFSLINGFGLRFPIQCA